MKKSKVYFQLFVFVLLAALLFTSTASAASQAGPSVSLSVEQSEFDSTQDVLVTITISNPTRHAVRVLKWFTPAEGVEEPLFTVTRDGEPVPYAGAIYKRPAATSKDYIALKSGESLVWTVNLADAYDLSQSGQYEISYAVASFHLFSEKGNAFQFRDRMASESISIKVEGRGEPQISAEPLAAAAAAGTSFTSCTTAQQTTLNSARNQAKTYASGAKSYLASHSSGTQRYLEWFGVFSSSRYNTVSNHFTAISDAMSNANVTFNCKCKQNYYAYVYPTKPYTIYLCKVFWKAPLAGTDSQGGTLVHEMSHFNVVAGTDDFVYGQTGARNLADTDPDSAVMNADNHEYFAENNPALP